MDEPKKKIFKKKKISKKSKAKTRSNDCTHIEKEKLRKKLNSYLNDGRLEKIRKCYQKFSRYGWTDDFIDEINRPYGEQQWTHLHEYSSTGELTLVQFLLEHSADTEVLDRQGNTFVHSAFNYIIESFDRNFLYYILDRVLSTLQVEMLTQQNKYGETIVDLLEEITNLFTNQQKQFLEPESESEEDEISEKAWNEKLFAEMAADESRCYGNEMFVQDEYEDTFKKVKTETFDEWGDRMRYEYNRKHRAKHDHNLKNNASNTDNSKTKKKAKLGPVNNLKELRCNLELLKLRERYEQSCTDIFKKKSNSLNEGTLRFNHIPWNHFPAFTLDEIDEAALLDSMVNLFSHGFTDADKMKYLKVQRIRWHPDKFLQRCGHRLLKDDRQRILELVKNVSQRINAEITSLES